MMRGERSRSNEARRLGGLLVAGVILAASCGGSQGTGEPQGVDTVSPNPAPTSAVPATPLPTGDLPPGRYSFDLSTTTVSFQLGPGWLNENQIPDVAFELVLGEAVEPPARQAITVFAKSESPEKVIGDVEDVREVNVESKTPVEFAGLGGTQLDLSVSGGEEHVSVLLIGPEGPDYFLASGNLGRITVLDLDGTALVVAQESNEQDFDAFAAASAGVMDSMSFG